MRPGLLQGAKRGKQVLGVLLLALGIMVFTGLDKNLEAWALGILTQFLGPENPNETGMFREFYWILPIGKFIESHGLEHFELSMDAIADVTKRNTGEYAVRPFIRKYPKNACAAAT